MASSRTILESIAIRLRAKLEMTDVEYIDLKAVLEMMVILFPGFSYRRVADSVLHGAKGMYNSDTDTIEIPNNVFLGMENRIPHFRFSVAHEIAHAVLRHEGVKFRHAERKAYEKANPSVWRDEREAEQFAAIFLAPTHLAKKCKTVEEIQSKFGLSTNAAEIRKKEIEADIRRTNGEVPPLPTKVVDFLRYAESKGYRTSSPSDQHRQAPQKEATDSHRMKWSAPRRV